MNTFLRLLVVPVALIASASARAQLLEDLDLRREGADAVLQVRFNTPIQFRLALVGQSSDTAQAFYDVLSIRDLADVVPSERRIRGGGAMPDIIVSDEGARRELLGRKLVLRLSKPTPMKIRAGKGDRSIELVLDGLGASIPNSLSGASAAPTTGFQISLLQSDTSNPQMEAPIPSALQTYQVFTGQRVVDGRTVYEVSLGYFNTLGEADSARKVLLQRFPRATIVSLAPPPAPPAPAPTPASPPASPPAPVIAAAPVVAPPPQSSADIEILAAALLAAAKDAEAQKDHGTALDKLNQLLNLPANTLTREAQAMAGDVRALAGDPVRARIEYSTFLSLFPTGPDADRVRAAMARLPAAAPAAPPTVAASERPKVAPSSTVTGSISEFYYGGASKVRTQDFQDSPIGGLPVLAGDNTLAGTDQKQLLSNVDLNWRYRDTDTDMRFVFRDSYTSDQLNSDKSKNRLSALYFEHRSLTAGTSVRLGRQSPTGGGVLGRFDGVQAGYLFAPKWRINGVFGVPTDALLDSKRHFYGAWIDAEALTKQISGSLYYNRQIIDGEVDRSAAGAELRYFNGGVSVTSVLDVDTAIRGLNIASIQGTWQLEDTTVFNVLYDRRKTPMLMLGNALFFQDPALPLATRLRDLIDAGNTVEDLRNRVRATTSNTTQGLIGVTTPISKNWQIGGDVRLTDVGEVLPVAVILPSGQGRSKNNALGGQLIGTNLYSGRDTHVFSVSVLRGTNYSLATPDVPDSYNGLLFSYNNSSQVNELLLVEPSLKYYRQNDGQGVQISRWSPGLRLTYRVVKQVSLESELSGEYSKTVGPNRTESSSRYLYYVGGRYDF